jgi:5-methylcytosine-specific restriction endonuclease McrA
LSTLQNCSVCHGDFALTFEFWYRERTAKSGFTGTCKGCIKKRQREYYQANLEKVQERHRIYSRSRSPESRHAEYERTREHKREYAQENAERIAQRKREYRIANIERFSEKDRDHHAANRDKRNAKIRAWAAANRERVLANAAKHRALRDAAPGVFTSHDVGAQYAAQRGQCFYCACDLAKVRFHIDHVIPLSRGGTNYPDNIVIACPRCNLEKGTKLPHEFKRRKE